MAECIDKIEGSVTNTESGVMHMVLREPLGVVGAISPWNYPLLMAAWKIAPALAAGNTRRAEARRAGAASSCLRLAELFVEAGGPPGVLNVVNGLGEVAGKALALHPDVAKITFTGSTEVGKLMLPVRRAVEHEARGARVRRQVAAGLHGRRRGPRPRGHRGLSTASSPTWARSATRARACWWIARIYDEFLATLHCRGQHAYQPGDPLDPATNMGPLVTREAQTRVLGLIETGQREGARLCSAAACRRARRGRLRQPDAVHRACATR